MELVPATVLLLVVAITGLLSARTIEERKLKNVGKVLISGSSHN
jgi:hypothetical protein